MSKPTRRKKERQIRRLVSESIDRTRKALERKREKADETPSTPDPKHDKPQSRKSVKSQPHRAKGTKFLDPKRRAYEVSERGELRVINKPRSRVKRLRELSTNTNEKPD